MLFQQGSSVAELRAHDPRVAGSIPAPAPIPYALSSSGFLPSGIAPACGGPFCSRHVFFATRATVKRSQAS